MLFAMSGMLALLSLFFVIAGVTILLGLITTSVSLFMASVAGLTATMLFRAARTS